MTDMEKGVYDTCIFIIRYENIYAYVQHTTYVIINFCSSIKTRSLLKSQPSFFEVTAMIWVTDSLAQIHNRITTAELPAYHVSQTWAGVPLHAVSYDRQGRSGNPSHGRLKNQDVRIHSFVSAARAISAAVSARVWLMWVLRLKICLLSRVVQFLFIYLFIKILVCQSFLTLHSIYHK